MDLEHVEMNDQLKRLVSNKPFKFDSKETTSHGIASGDAPIDDKDLEMEKL